MFLLVRTMGRIHMTRKITIETRHILITIGLILLGITSRYILVSSGGPPNFEFIMVLGFLAALLLRPSLAIFVPLLCMIGSDILLGNSIFVGNQANRIVLFTYSGFSMIALLTIFNRTRLRNRLGTLNVKTIGITAGLGVGFVLLYDIWTNLGWWYLIYPHTAANLAMVYAAGIPFMITHILSGALTFVCIALPVLVYLAQKQKIEIPLKLRTIHKIPIIAVVTCLIVLSFTGTAMKLPEKSEIWLEQSNQTSVQLVIRGEGWTITDHLVAYAGDTVFSLLQRCSKQQHFVLESTYYESFDSTLVESINHNTNGNEGKYWQYYVNGDIPMVGCDQYIVSNGDSIVWSFELVSY